ncbi:acyl-CoA dehydrogenase [Aeromicrobium sp.]|uniref:acyl-CoA dehydrogenase n=1 Tax=Aeromicrobium sp. TaxID=1871063 RepID=UPI0025BEE08A|nr:acyl-CoA dehydrogenase [Aeromicrobium sp.]
MTTHAEPVSSLTANPATITVDDLVSAVHGALPHPGDGSTAARWRALAAVARADLPLAKLVEPHHDAAAILRDLDGPPQAVGDVWGVWAAEPPFARLTADQTGDGWFLSGRKAFCSGASLVTHALATADAGRGSRLFAIDMRHHQVSADMSAPAWSGHGMHRADTGTLLLEGVPATPVGQVGGYVSRAGFWHGAIGIAASWWGGAQGVADTLEGARERLDKHGLAHLGAVRADLDNLGAVIAQSAAQIDEGEASDVADAERLALSTRSLAADVVDRVIARVGRALGPGPLAFDQHHADHVADLQVFVRQHHAERDLERLGAWVPSRV